MTTRENEILAYTAVGLSTKEMADRLNRSQETVRKTISNIKVKLGLQKATELTAYYFCDYMGKSFIEFKKQILANCLLVLFSFAMATATTEKQRIRLTPRRWRFEYVEVF